MRVRATTSNPDAPCARPLAALAAALCLLSLPALACAQQPEPAEGGSEGEDELSPEEEDRLFELDGEVESRQGDDLGVGEAARVREKPLEQMKVEELREAGFVFGDTSASRRRSTALIMAIGPGLLLHGAGHLYLGEERTAVALALMEFSGLGLIALGSALPWVARGQLAGSGAARPAFYSGLGLLVSSYVLDIVGVARGDEPVIYATPEQRPGAALMARYTFLDSPTYPVRNMLAAGASVDLGGAYAELETRQDVLLFASRYGGTLGWRVWSLPLTSHQIFIQADASLMQLRGQGRFSRLAVGGRAGGTLDLGVLTPQLRRVYLGVNAGYMHQWYALPTGRAPEVDAQSDDPPPLEWAHSMGAIPFEVVGGMNFTDRFHLRLAYSREDGEPLHGINRLFAVPSVQATYRLSRGLDLLLAARYGERFALSGGFRVWAWEP